MRTSHRIGVALTAWVMMVIGAGGAVAQASPGSGAVPHSHSAAVPAPRSQPELRGGSSHHQPAICPANGIPGAPTELPSRPLQRYFLGDPRLGPKRLPETGAVGELLREYHRLDSFRPDPFIDCFWDPAANMNMGGWRFPPNNGFADGFTSFQMVPGQVIDRFGSNGGRFFSPFGVPFAQRALPPSSLDTLERRYPFNYHVFKVLKSFEVQAGVAAPWFGQPGGGLQYRSSLTADQLLAQDLVEPLN